MIYDQGDIVLLHFPFTDLSSSKQRPALILSNQEFNTNGEDVVTCLITTNLESDQYSVMIQSSDLVMGSLPVKSRIKSYRIFTAAKYKIVKKIGTLSKAKMNETVKKIALLLDSKA